MNLVNLPGSPPDYEVSEACYSENGCAYDSLKYEPSDHEVPTDSSPKTNRMGRYLVWCQCVPGTPCHAPEPHCYQMHTFCWSFLNKVLGSRVENNMDTLLESIEVVWEQGTAAATTTSDTPSADDESGQQQHCLEVPHSGSFPGTLSMFGVPSSNPALERLIDHCRIDSDSLSEKEASSDDEVPLRQRRGSFGRPGRLPVELQLTVLDFLTDIADIGNAVAAFQWSVSGSYLRRRFPYKAIYELDDISTDELDWSAFIIGFNELLMDPSWGIRHRLRIFKIVCSIRDKFLELELESDKSE
ncbi:hypothetical protein CIHG_05623 [Coccidioides immitis H538.4]|uniref:Uncharacterized protein n=2 Tax=Coccidioides immitis TaxID=5501 RepID=A0A0J8RTE8_COCIT|nr:hypothetical protein CIRG_08405 [Coccidioides immitis RMSCC 2394]KMU87856.1 hypothetical protein CIHG_05623 [Coccidioides immitis H538.4]